MFEIRDRGIEFQMEVKRFMDLTQIRYIPEPIIKSAIGVRGRRTDDKRIYRPDWEIPSPIKSQLDRYLEATIHKGNPWKTRHKRGQLLVAEAAGYGDRIAVITPPELDQLLQIASVSERRTEFFTRIMGFRI